MCKNEETKSDLSLAVYVLGLGIFSMTTSEFMVAGLMPSLSRQFGVSISDIGFLISIYAGGMVVGGPVLTLILLKLARKTALLILVAVFFAGQTLGALADSYDAMAVARAITGVSSSAFFGMSLAACADLVAPEFRGRAASIVLGGLMVATVFGLPLATLIDQHYGWRVSFGSVAILTLLCGVVILFTVPLLPQSGGLSLRTELRAFGNRHLWAAYATSGLIIGATFAAFSYFSPIFIEVGSFSPAIVPWLLVLYGAATVFGNIVVGRLADRYMITIPTIGLMTLVTVLTAFSVFASYQYFTVFAVVMLGLAGVPMNPALATRVMRVGNARPLVNTVHTSVICLGVVIGSWLGGLAISAGYGVASPLWVGACLAALGLASLAPYLHLTWVKQNNVSCVGGCDASAQRPMRSTTR
jgi:predicted MFS family arabinose efflux permease